MLGLRDLLYLADVTDLDFDSEYEITVVAVNNEELTRSSDVWFVNTTSQSMIRFIIIISKLYDSEHSCGVVALV